MPKHAAQTDNSAPPSRPRPNAGGHKYPDEFKAAVIEDAKERILQGQTMKQIADVHGVSAYCLHLWMHALGDEYKELRQTWIDSLLIDAGQEIDGAAEDFELARGRERWRKAIWYAERRDPARYGAKPQEQAASITVLIDNSCGGTVRIAQNNTESVETPLIDVTPNPMKSTG